MDEVFASNNEEKTPLVVNVNTDAVIQIDEILARRRKSTSDGRQRRAAIIIEAHDNKRSDSHPAEHKKERQTTAQAIVPKKIQDIRKGSVVNILRGISMPGQRKGRTRNKLTRGKTKNDDGMPVIHSDTDTESDNRRLRSLDRKVRRNESNSSADRTHSKERSSASRTNSMKSTQVKKILVYIILNTVCLGGLFR